MSVNDKKSRRRTVVVKDEVEFFDLIDQRLNREGYALLETVLGLPSKEAGRPKKVADDLGEPV